MPANSDAPMDRHAALERLAGDAELLDELIPLMLEQSRQLTAEIRTALAERAASTVVIAAHTIKGSAANLEATPLADAARRLETMARADDLGEGLALCETIEAEVERLARYVATEGGEAPA